MTAALVTTCGGNRATGAAPSPLADATARANEPWTWPTPAARVRGPSPNGCSPTRPLCGHGCANTLEQCADAFFAAAWAGVTVQLATDLRLKHDLLRHQGLGAALTSVSGAVTLAPDGDHIIVDRLQDKSTTAHAAGVTFIPSVFGRPHCGSKHSPIRYDCACCAPWPAALTPPASWPTPGNCHPPEVSRHLAVLRRAGLLTTERHGRYVRNLPGLTSLGTDVLTAVLR